MVFIERWSLYKSIAKELLGVDYREVVSVQSLYREVVPGLDTLIFGYMNRDSNSEEGRGKGEGEGVGYHAA